MSPIHDTDSPEERWSKAEWEHYELFEKLEARLRRKKRWGLIAGFSVFLFLSAIPVVIDRAPQWLALKATRELAEQISRLKREAGIRELALRLRVDPTQPLKLLVEKAPRCDSANFEPDQEIELLAGDARRSTLSWLDPVRGKDVGIPGLLSQVCFDPLSGSDAANLPGGAGGFVILPVKELTESPDRYAVILLTGPSAEISFE